MKPKRALVIGGGGLMGAYDAGVTTVLCQELGPDYFDAIFATSVGVFAAAFYTSNQPNVIENTWRHLVCGPQLIGFLKPFAGRQILDLEYLVEIFQNEKSCLDVEKIYNSPVHLVYTLTELATGKVRYISPRPQNIFDAMRAACALPLIHKPVEVGGIKYVDGALSDPFPLQKAIDDGYEEIIAVYNKPAQKITSTYSDLLTGTIALFYHEPIKHLVQIFNQRELDLEEQLKPRRGLKIIRPKGDLPIRSITDTDKQRLNLTIDQGQADAKEFLKQFDIIERRSYA